MNLPKAWRPTGDGVVKFDIQKVVRLVALSIGITLLAALGMARQSFGQDGPSNTVVDGAYGALSNASTALEAAMRYESDTLAKKVLNAEPSINWIGGGDQFWYKKESKTGYQFILVKSRTGRQGPLFDHDALAKALSQVTGEELAPNALPIVDLEVRGKHLSIRMATGDTIDCDISSYKCSPKQVIDQAKGIVSPDGRKTALVIDYNVWIRDNASGALSQVTHDGVQYFTYGDAGGGGLDFTYLKRIHEEAAKPLTGLVWSPDGRYLATIRTDLRNVPLRPFVIEFLPKNDNFTVAHYTPYEVAGDNIIPLRRVAIIDLRSGLTVTAQVESDKLQDYAIFHFRPPSIWWDLQRKELYLHTASRDAKTYGLIAVDVRSGNVRTVIEETEAYYYDFNPNDYGQPNFYVTTDGNEMIWYSQRSGYGHLYLYDAQTGRLKSAITSGDWVVHDLLRVDEKRRLLYFTAGGREHGDSPYYRKLYRATLDGKSIKLLSPADADHEFTSLYNALSQSGLDALPSKFSPNGKYFVDTFSTISIPPVTQLRKENGDLVATIIEADAEALYATGWKPPERFTVKAADGKTELYGVLIKPIGFDPTKRYAVIENTYPGPTGSFGPQNFMSGFRGLTTNNLQVTAELGFVCVALDGRGTRGRGKAFQYAFSGTEDVFGALDHKVAIENLAARVRYMDISRIGLVGASFGGYGTARAALLYPDFFDVVVSYVGPGDYRTTGRAVSNERFFGTPGRALKEGVDYYDLISNTRLAGRLTGNLLLVYGELDENVPINQAFAMFDALIKADKVFDTLIIPGATHGGAYMDPYAFKRQLNYFRQHLGPPQ
jgi:dipeptidyl-peptidase 4